MLLSIVIPSYGRGGLADAIGSCLGQELPAGSALDVVLVDNTAEGRLQSTANGYGDRVRWVHEPRPGVSHARNTGVREARGQYVAFLDDDEQASPGWAAALLRHAASGGLAVFGPVVPSLAAVTSTLHEVASSVYARDFALADGADITAKHAYLGTGNSMFHRSCFAAPEPFSIALADLGGEDSAFIRDLVQRGIRLTWAANARVDERVPAERLTFASLAARRFRQGQIRSLVGFMAPGFSKADGLMWMAVGLVQVCLYGLPALAIAIFDPTRGKKLGLRAISGAGKMLWHSKFWRRTYGAGLRVESPTAKAMPMPSELPVVSIIVVNYRTRELTLQCLRSIEVETTRVRYEVLLVDNSADQQLAEAVAADFPAVRLIQPTDNIGFARANNVAAEHARGQFILLLNPDTIVLDHAIDRLVEFARQRTQARLWGGRTVFPDRSLNHMSCWRRMTLWNVFCRTAGLTALFPSSSIFHSEAYGGWDRSSEARVDIVSGCFLLITRELWQRLGGFDPAFFMYGEEADLCLRAHKLGARPAVTPEATIVHYGGASKQPETEKHIQLMAAKAELIKRHWPTPKRQIGLFLFSMLPLTRAVTLEIADRASHTARATIWWTIWRARGRWKFGYSNETCAT